ncbi:hypothetical protein RQP46_007877 [Phenoliferia psychrophenolica]
MGTTALDPPLKIAQIGAGLGGLAFTLSLLDQIKRHSTSGIELVVYEGAKAFGEVGAAVGMGANAREVLRHLGLDDEYVAISTPGLSLEFHWATSDFPRVICPDIDGSEKSASHRGHLLGILVEKVPENLVQFSKRLVSHSIDPTKSSLAITLTFADGTTDCCDVLIGADGINSATRDRMFDGTGISMKPVYTGTDVTRCLVPIGTIAAIIGDEPSKHPQIYLGDNKQLHAVDAPSRWPLYEVPDLPYFNCGHIVLLGDAAHGFLPTLGAGAGVAFEDGVVLAALLGHPSITRYNVAQALQTYSDCRMGRTTYIKRVSREEHHHRNGIHFKANADLVKFRESLEVLPLFKEWTVAGATAEAIGAFLK